MNGANEGPFRVPEKDRREERKIYYLKLSDRFFKDKTIKLLRKRAGGDTYTVILLKLFLQSLEDENHLYYDGIVPTFEEELALSIDEKPEDIKVVLDFLATYGWLIEESKDSYYLPKSAEMSGSITQSGLRKRRQRERERELLAGQSHNDVTQLSRSSHGDVTPQSQSVTKYIDRDRDRDKAIDREDARGGREKRAGNIIHLSELPSLYPDAFTDEGPILPYPTLDEVREYQRRNGFDRGLGEYTHRALEELGWNIEGSYVKDWRSLMLLMESDMRNGSSFVFPNEDGEEAEDDGEKEEDGISDEE